MLSGGSLASQAARSVPPVGGWISSSSDSVGVFAGVLVASGVGVNAGEVAVGTGVSVAVGRAAEVRLAWTSAVCANPVFCASISISGSLWPQALRINPIRMTITKRAVYLMDLTDIVIPTLRPIENDGLVTLQL